MELTCPKCASRFRAPDEAFAGGPRKVRCGRCKHLWSAGPEAGVVPEAAPVPDDLVAEPKALHTQADSEPRVTPPSEAHDVDADHPPPVTNRKQEQVIDAPSSAVAPGNAPAPSTLTSPVPAPTLENRDRYSEQGDWARPDPADGSARYQGNDSVRGSEKKSGGLAIGWILLILVVIGVLAAGWHYRDQVVEKVPQLQKVYDMIDAQLAPGTSDGLELRGVTSILRTIGGERRMVIEGAVVNVSQEPQAVPLLRAVILDPSGQEIAQWDFDPGAKSLDPGDRVEFSTSTSAPEGESQIDLIFFPR